MTEEEKDAEKVSFLNSIFEDLFFHKLLKNGKLVHALLRVSGKRLRREY